MRPSTENARRLAALLTYHLVQVLVYLFMLHEAEDTHADPIPYHTSVLSGQAWVNELYNSPHPDRILCELGVRKHIFNILIEELRYLGYTQSRYVSLEEKLAIFLYSCVTGLSIRHVGERFQRSNETISIYFKEMLDAFSDPRFYNRYVHLPTDTTPLPSKFKNNPKFFPFFEDALGAIDGSHIPSWPSKEERQFHRDRKGQVSQNILCCCSFNMLFQYSVTGYDGSAADATMFAQSRMEDFAIPDGKYYLADAGFPSCRVLLVPYRGVRYHLKEWGRANLAPVNAQELFNLRHAQARNVVERIFGVLKKRWACLCSPLKYDMTVQARIPSALIAIHNLLLRYDPMEALNAADESDDEAWDPAPRGDTEAQLSSAVTIPRAEQVAADARRDEIANAMWIQYQDYLENNL
ncbi:Transposon en spm sub-class [Mycena kentingensis (nom. inval.)]|nr:Transposon en spm sub-class [Mycena kentingensis (nom. inval.)]